VTGPLGSDEIAPRTSIGYGLLVPPGENERLLASASLSVLAVKDTTAGEADVAQRRYEARARHTQELRAVEGVETFEGRQRFFRITAQLAREHRLSGLVFLAEKRPRLRPLSPSSAAGARLAPAWATPVGASRRRAQSGRLAASDSTT
jgi:hypothetical protein